VQVAAALLWHFYSRQHHRELVELRRQHADLKAVSIVCGLTMRSAR